MAPARRGAPDAEQAARRGTHGPHHPTHIRLRYPAHDEVGGRTRESDPEPRRTTGTAYAARHLLTGQGRPDFAIVTR